MNRIDDLIAEHCPDGVEFKRLGDIVRIKNGKDHKQLGDGEFPVFGSGGVMRYANTYAYNKPSVLIPRKGSLGNLFFVDVPFWNVDTIFYTEIDEAQIRPKFLYYFLTTVGLGEMNQAGGVPSQTQSVLNELQIPVPPLEVQREIVKILDTFTKLKAELKAELEARKKQYNYYREQLLSFSEGEVEWKTLGDVTKKWYSGGTPTAGEPEYYEDGDIPWLRTQEVKFSDIEITDVKITQAAVKASAAKWIPANCVIIAISGATAGRSAINKIPLTTNQHCGCLEIDSTRASYRYVFHWVSFNYEAIKSLGQGPRGDLNSTIIKNFKLPIPYSDDPEKSLAEQARIVDILDKFNTLATSTREGLPREIELRQKQYEYYRDLLLIFPKRAVEEISNG